MKRLLLVVPVMLALAGAAASAQTGGRAATAGTATNRIPAENALPGTTAWKGSPLAATSHALEGYADAADVAPGASVGLHLSASPATTATVKLYRLGWYGGKGGRLLVSYPGI